MFVACVVAVDAVAVAAVVVVVVVRVSSAVVVACCSYCQILCTCILVHGSCLLFLRWCHFLDVGLG